MGNLMSKMIYNQTYPRVIALQKPAPSSQVQTLQNPS